MYVIKLVNQPDTDGYVEKYEGPVTHGQKHHRDDDLHPQLRDVPKVETGAAFLSVQVVALKVYSRVD